VIKSITIKELLFVRLHHGWDYLCPKGQYAVFFNKP